MALVDNERKLAIKLHWEGKKNLVVDMEDEIGRRRKQKRRKPSV
jgi:hypothetical protein